MPEPAPARDRSDAEAPAATGGPDAGAAVGAMSFQSAGRPPDARSAVREGLRRVVAQLGDPPEAPDAARAWCNRLLDETGSDRRGLVQLLLRVRADGVVAELPSGPMTPAAWAPVRARLAFAYAASTYLDAEMARWAVDAWAYAHGVIGADGLWAPPAPPAPAPSRGAMAPLPARTPTPPAPVVAAAATAAAAAGGPAGKAAPGKVPARVRRAVARSNAPPVHNPFPKHFDRLVGGAFVALLVIAAAGMWVGIAARREAGGLEVPPGPSVADVSARGVAAEPLPPARPSRRAPPSTSSPAAAPAAGAAASLASAEDTLRLRDGTVRTGQVTRITHEAVLLRDLWSDTVHAIDLDDVLELRARAGSVVPVGDGAGRVSPVRDGAADGEYGGRYRVRQTLVGVEGTATCDVVAEAVRRASERPSVEVVAHDRGAGAFVLVSRPGVRGTVDADGRFQTGVIRGVRDGVHYWFRMTGQFDRAGFRAETESATDAVLKYGSVQRCHVTASLDATRLPE